MRLFVTAAAVFALAACNEASPPAATNQAEAPAAATPADGAFEARVNMGPVDPAKAKTLMHARHEGMEEIGDEFKKLRREFGGSSPDMTAVASSAATIERLSREAGDWFPSGTGPDVGKTEAKAEIWQKPQDFAAKMGDFQKQAAAFNAAAKSGNAGAAKTAFGSLGKTCKACHDPYREEH